MFLLHLINGAQSLGSLGARVTFYKLCLELITVDSLSET